MTKQELDILKDDNDILYDAIQKLKKRKALMRARDVFSCDNQKDVSVADLNESIRHLENAINSNTAAMLQAIGAGNAGS